MKKGFVFSIDSLIALSVTLALLVISASYLALVKDSALPSAFLKDFSMDAVTVLEKTGLLESAVDTNSSTGIAFFLNRLPQNICIEVNIFNESDTEKAIMTVLKNGCTANYEEKSSLKRSFLAGSEPSFYIAKVSAWYKISE